MFKIGVILITFLELSAGENRLKIDQDVTEVSQNKQTEKKIFLYIMKHHHVYICSIVYQNAEIIFNILKKHVQLLLGITFICKLFNI